MRTPTGSMGVLLVLAAAVLSLPGCAGVRAIDSTVQSHSAWTATTTVAGQSYRFERLPLSGANAAGQANLERWTTRELSRFGLLPLASDGGGPRYTVLVSAEVDRYDSLPPGGGAGPSWRFGIGVGGGSDDGGWGASPFIGAGFDNYLAPTPRYRRAFEIVLRNAANGEVVYQSRAFNDSGWWDDTTVLPALVQAALEGFPKPPAASRVVRIPLREDAD